MPKLAHFLLKYKHQQREQTEVRGGRDEDCSGWMIAQSVSLGQTRLLELDSYYFFVFSACLQSVCDESDETSKKAEEVEPKSTTHLTYELIDPNHVVPALKSFLQQHMRSR